MKSVNSATNIFLNKSNYCYHSNFFMPNVWQTLGFKLFKTQQEILNSLLVSCYFDAQEIEKNWINSKVLTI